MDAPRVCCYRVSRKCLPFYGKWLFQIAFEGQILHRHPGMGSVDSNLLSHYRPGKGERIIYAQFDDGRRKGARHSFGMSQVA